VSIYEATLILDNREVKKGWRTLKGRVKELLERHGCKVVAARRWEDRKLAYEIKKQKRGTYFLSYLEHPSPGDSLFELDRDLLLQDFVLRHLILKVEAVPESEVELSAKEDTEIANEPDVIGEGADEGQVVVVRQRTAADDAPPAPSVAAPAASSPNGVSTAEQVSEV
jgi:small subunit ribosomal protein S6